MYIQYLGMLMISGAAYSQINNQGVFSVLPNTKVSMEMNFENRTEGQVLNNGTIYYFKDFLNDGLYIFDSQLKKSYAVFQPSTGKTEKQILSGRAQSHFYDVLFNNPTSNTAFELQNDMSVAGIANFKSGVIQMDSLNGALVFEKGAQAINVSDISHVDGQVEKVGNEAFVFPIGNQNFYRPATISAPSQIKDAILAKYYLRNSDDRQPHSDKTGVIEQINHAEYWTVENNNPDSTIILTLSWDERTTPLELLDDSAKNLRILRWDSNQNLWVDEGGIVDFESKTVTSPLVVSGFGVFTLGTVKEELLLDGDIVIYNAVSPNGDGYNDYFIIDNIERFPNNTVEIYNRWGVRVFETNNYNSTGNVFRGISEGRVTVDKKSLLPTGTYYYIINYEYIDENGTRMVKKAGYLHLENN